jgi:hypothetical protein
MTPGAGLPPHNSRLHQTAELSYARFARSIAFGRR